MLHLVAACFSCIGLIRFLELDHLTGVFLICVLSPLFIYYHYRRLFGFAVGFIVEIENHILIAGRSLSWQSSTVLQHVLDKQMTRKRFGRR
jgi:hypothetical protein